MKQPDSEEDLINRAEPDAAGVEDIETLKQALSEQKVKAESNLSNWQRAQADFVNYKRRSEQEKEEIGKFANTTLMLSLLPILDDLGRAFDSTPPKLAKLTWVDGIKLIERKLQASLEAQGLSSIKALDEPFDPIFHEAVRGDKGKEGIVIEELQKGYKLHDRIVRPTMVVVGNGEDKEE